MGILILFVLAVGAATMILYARDIVVGLFRKKDIANEQPAVIAIDQHGDFVAGRNDCEDDFWSNRSTTHWRGFGYFNRF